MTYTSDVDKIIGWHYTMNGGVIQQLHSIRDFGISRLTVDWNSAHIINNVVTKAFQRSGIIFRGFSTRNPDFLMRAYKTYVRPILGLLFISLEPVFTKRYRPSRKCSVENLGRVLLSNSCSKPPQTYLIYSVVWARPNRFGT